MDNSAISLRYPFESFNSQGFVSDIDECKTGKWPCAEEATCNNQEGSFSCACPKGYHGDGEYFCEGKIRSIITNYRGALDRRSVNRLMAKCCRLRLQPLFECPYRSTTSVQTFNMADLLHTGTLLAEPLFVFLIE